MFPEREWSELDSSGRKTRDIHEEVNWKGSSRHPLLSDECNSRLHRVSGLKTVFLHLGFA
jgi:hypothetical protein